MKTARFVIPALAAAALVTPILIAPAHAQDSARAIASKVGAVTVYEDRALVTRTADVTLDGDVTRVAIEGLPPGLDPASLRAKTSGAQVLGVEFEAVHRDTVNSDVVRASEADVQRARTALREVEMALEDALKEREMLLSIRAKSLERAAEGLTGRNAVVTKDIGDLLDFVRERVASLGQSIRASETELVARKSAVEAAAARLREVQGGGTKEVLRAVVTLRGASGAAAPLEISYIVPGATWRPLYALRVDGDFGAAVLELSAEVSQQTGEDWGNVALEVTTARPAAGAAPPEPFPWRIAFPRPQAREESRRRQVAAKMELSDAADDARDEKKSGAAWGLVAASVRESGLVVAFGAHRPETVRSGARPSRVTLASFELTPDVTWTAFPRATKDVFVTAQLTNETGAALPGGETRVFVGPDYVGPMQLGDWGMGEKVRVGLGADRQVEAEREALVESRGTEGLFSKETVHTRRYRITVKNHRTRPITARILDQLPVSGDEDLSVKLTETSLPQATLPKDETETNAARGVLEWSQPVAPGTTLELRFGFEIRHPQDKSVEGL